MKQPKRILAILAVVVLLLIFCLPMYFAFGKGEGAQNNFMAAVGVAVFVPIFAYICIMAVRIFGKHKEKNTGEIRNIVFDIGRVLVDFSWEEYLEGLGFTGEAFDRIAAATFAGPIWPERDRSALSDEEYLEQMIALAPEYPEEIRKVVERSYETIHLRDYAVPWMRFLKDQGYHLYLLSNYSTYMWEHTLNELAFVSLVDGMVISCNEKVIKPEPEIYQLLLDRYHLKASETVFIDDTEINCAAAEKLGIHAIHFESFPQAAAALEKYGVRAE